MKKKVIAIPFAGGDKNSYNTLQKFIPKHLDFITLELPGRGNRIEEDLLGNIDEMANDLLCQITPLIKQNKYLIYGHSMGSTLGYELTKKILQFKLNTPDYLFFTGSGAPSIKQFNKKSELPKDKFWDALREMGGLSNEILDCEDLLEFYYPILKSDFKAFENYKYIRMNKPFLIPIHVCVGTEEIGEMQDKISLNSIRAWNNETSSFFSFDLLKGNHFFIFKNARIIAQKLSSMMR